MMDEAPPWLALPEGVTIVEVVTGATALSVVISAVFNQGFFGRLDGGVMAWLTVQDLITGAAVAFAPALLVVQLTLILRSAVVDHPSLVKIINVIAIGLLIAALILPAAINELTPLKIAYGYQQVAFEFAFILFFVLLWSAGGYGIATPIKVVVLVAGVHGATYNAGALWYWNNILDYSKPTTMVVTAQTSFLGRMIRTTSGYTFLFDGKDVVALPNNEIITVHFINALGPV